MSRFKRFRSDSAGATGIMVALLLPVLIGFAALGIDYGSFVFDRNHLQDAADLAALQAATHTGTETATARQSFRENGFEDLALTVTRGRLVADASGQKSFRPEASGDGVLVEASKTSKRFFSTLFLSEDPVIRVRAVATSRPIVSASVGSSLMTLSGGVPGTVTRALFGSDINLSLLSYRGLMNSRISTSDFITTLALSIGMENATIGEVFDRPVSKQVLLQAVAAQMRGDGKTAEASFVSNLLNVPMLAETKLSLKDILKLPDDLSDLRVGAPSDYLTAKINALGLVTATLAPNSNGSTVSLALSLPKLASAQLDVLIGEPMLSSPALKIGDIGLLLSTAQVRARFHLKAQVDLPIFKFGIDLPVEVAIAPGVARVVSADCTPGASDRKVLVEATPGAIRIEIGKQAGPLQTVGLLPSNKSETIAQVSIGKSGHPALSQKVVFGAAGHGSGNENEHSAKHDTPLARIDVHGLFTVQSGLPRQAWFSSSDVADGTIRSIGSVRMISKYVDDLLSTLTIDPHILNTSFGIGTRTLADATETALAPLSPALDTLLDGLLQAMGLKVGAMDVRIDDLLCSAPQIAA